MHDSKRENILYKYLYLGENVDGNIGLEGNSRNELNEGNKDLISIVL